MAVALSPTPALDPIAFAKTFVTAAPAPATWPEPCEEPPLPPRAVALALPPSAVDLAVADAVPPAPPLPLMIPPLPSPPSPPLAPADA